MHCHLNVFIQLYPKVYDVRYGE